MTKRHPRLAVVRPSTLALIACTAVMVGVPAAAAVLESPRPAGVSASGEARRSMGSFADVLTSNSTPTAATVAGSAPTGGVVVASAMPFIVTTAKPGSAAATAIAFALAQRGLPYVWGGDGPQNGDSGFDCSGLTKAAYGAAGIDLPRTAHTQFYAGPHVPDGAPLEPGDLVFYGVPERVHHVGLYIGGGRMVNAPTFGKPVQIAYVRYSGDDYLGATRPAAGQDATGLVATSQLPVKVPPTPSPDAPKGPPTFPAPQAPDPTPDAVLGGATPQALKASPTLPDTPATPGPSTAVTPPGSSGTVPPTSATTAPPAGSTSPTGAESSTTVPPTTTPGSTTTAPPSSAGSTTLAPTTSAGPTSTAPPTTTTPPPVTTTTAPTTTAPPVTTTPPPPPAPAVAPTALTLPGGDVTLVATEPAADGLPPSPTAVTSGSRLWRAGTGVAGTAAVRVADAYDAAGLTVGSAVVATGPGDTRHALKVTSRRTLTPAQAKAVATALGTGFRVVILQVVPATGRVLVIVAA